MKEEEDEIHYVDPNRLQTILRDLMRGKRPVLSEADWKQINLLLEVSLGSPQCLSPVEVFLLRDLIWKDKKIDKASRDEAFSFIQFGDPQTCTLYPLIMKLLATDEKKVSPETFEKLCPPSSRTFNPEEWKLECFDYLKWKPCFLEKLLSRPPPCDIQDVLTEEKGILLPKAYLVSDRKTELTQVLRYLVQKFSPNKKVAIGGVLYVFIDQDGFGLGDTSPHDFYDWSFFDKQMIPVHYIFYDVVMEQTYSPEDDVTHAACLIVDNIRKTFELFDPHGSHAAYAPNEQMLTFLARQVIQIPKDYTTLTPFASCPQIWSWQTNLPRCFYYVILYFILRLSCPENTRESILFRVSELSEKEKQHLLAHTHCFVQEAINTLQFEKKEEQIETFRDPKIKRRLKRKLEQESPSAFSKEIKRLTRNPKELFRKEFRETFDPEKHCLLEFWNPSKKITRSYYKDLIEKYCQTPKQIESDMTKLVHRFVEIVNERFARPENRSEDDKRIFAIQDLDIIVRGGKEPLDIERLTRNQVTPGQIRNLIQTLTAVVKNKKRPILISIHYKFVPVPVQNPQNTRIPLVWDHEVPGIELPRVYRVWNNIVWRAASQVLKIT